MFVGTEKVSSLLSFVVAPLLYCCCKLWLFFYYFLLIIKFHCVVDIHDYMNFISIWLFLLFTFLLYLAVSHVVEVDTLLFLCICMRAIMFVRVTLFSHYWFCTFYEFVQFAFVMFAFFLYTLPGSPLPLHLLNRALNKILIYNFVLLFISILFHCLYLHTVVTKIYIECFIYNIIYLGR